MAIIGGGPGGGGPIGSGNPFTGPASTIEAMGNGVWAGWSGKQDPNNSSAEAFNFLSPNKGLIVEIGWMGDFAELTAGRYISCEVKLSNSVVLFMRGQLTSANDLPTSFPYTFPALVIPANSEVVITVATNEDDNVDQFVTIVGREI